MRRLAILAALFFAVPFAAAAQNMPKFELFGGYTYTRVFNTNGDTSSVNGGTGDVGVFPVKWAGLVADAGYTYSNGFTSAGTDVSAPSHSVHYFAGPRIRFANKRVTPYVQALFGGVHRSVLMTSTGTLLANPETSFAYTLGAGVDVKLARHFSLRLVQASYLHTSFHPVTGTQNSQNDFNIVSGIVIH